jgi:hypothetical protein
MRSLLDQILDRVEDGAPPVVLFGPEPCLFDDEIPEDAWQMGCRCLRCRLGHTNHTKIRFPGRRRYTQQSQWRTP